MVAVLYVEYKRASRTAQDYRLGLVANMPAELVCIALQVPIAARRSCQGSSCIRIVAANTPAAITLPCLAGMVLWQAWLSQKESNGTTANSVPYPLVNNLVDVACIRVGLDICTRGRALQKYGRRHIE